MDSLNLYWIPVLSLGVGMAIDLAIATLSRFHDSSLQLKNWALPLGITHATLPAASFGVFWLAANSVNNPQWVLGIVGFLLISIVVQELLFDAFGKTPLIDLSGKLSHLLQISHLASKRVLLVMSVSWDALACGAVVTSQATVGDWSALATVTAFVVYGVIAGGAAAMSLAVCASWRTKDVQHETSLAWIQFIGTFATSGR